MTFHNFYNVHFRHIAGVLLHEIDHSPDVVTKGVSTDRESYSLAAGLALGNVSCYVSHCD